jgi:hypothetical protein
LALSLTAFAAFADNPEPLLAPDSSLPAPAGATPTDTPAPSLGAENETPAPPSPEAQPAVPVSSIPGKTNESPSVTPQAAAEQKDIYEQYEDYLQKEDEKREDESTISQRTLFPHENGAWQFGLVYSSGAFGGYDFNWEKTPDAINNPDYAKSAFPTTQGANLSLTYFLLRSLSLGRLGIGAVGGIYWSQFTTETPNTGIGGTAVTKASPQQVTTYGLRAVYELDYWLGQLLVPFAFYGQDRVLIKAYSVGTVLSFPARQVTSPYMGGGLRFNLNRLEPTVASKALVNTGVRKFYLSYSALQRSGTFKSLTHNVGLDFEF